MRIHSDFFLFSAQNGAATALFKGQQIRINFNLLDDRLIEFINFYKKNNFEIPFVSNRFINSEVQELQNFFERNLIISTKTISDMDENYLAQWDDDNSFDFSKIAKSIKWYSIFGEEMNKKLRSKLPFAQVDQLDNLVHSDFCIAFIDTYNHEQIVNLATILKNKNCHWCFVMIDYLNSYIGPIRTLQSNFCFYCILSRYISNQDDPDFFKSLNSRHFSTEYTLPIFHIDIVVGNLISELVKFFTSDSSKLTSGIYEIGLVAPKTEYSHVLRFPNCRVCNAKH